MSAKITNDKLDINGLSIPQIKIEKEPEPNNETRNDEYQALNLSNSMNKQIFVGRRPAMKVFYEIDEDALLGPQFKSSIELKYEKMAERVTILEQKIAELEKKL
jgi:hypothetical protein